MYKQLKMYGDMVRLVKQYFPEHLDATHLQLAKVAYLLLKLLHWFIVAHGHMINHVLVHACQLLLASFAV